MTLDDMWIEKYRPKRLDEIVGQDEIIKRLKSYAQSKNTPHLMFSGPAGAGKTCSATALARELFGENWHHNFIELNASDERGIDVVRGKIKNFARSSPIGDTEFKIIFLDEGDALTNDAQSALRRTMENYTKVCRFIISCNYPSKVIEPIQSRCAVYKFKPLIATAIDDRIKTIAKAEGLEVTPRAMNAIKYVAQGDMRKAINALQGAAIINKIIDDEHIYKTASIARPEDITDLVMSGLEGNFSKTRTKLEYLLIDQGGSADEIVKQIYRSIFEINISDKMRVDIIDQIGEIDFRISEGADTRIQLDALIARLVLHGVSNI